MDGIHRYPPRNQTCTFKEANDFKVMNDLNFSLTLLIHTAYKYFDYINPKFSLYWHDILT